MSKVAILPASYENVAGAVDEVFEVFPLNVEGKKVLVKPNVLRASEAKEGIVTHPSVLKAVVEKIESMNPASLVVGDNPGLFNYGANEESFEKTGLMEAAGRYYKNIGNDSRKVPFDLDFMESVSVSSAVLDADVVFSLPKFKTHGLTVITGAIKNCYGYLPGAQKARLHKAAGNPERFHDLIVKTFSIRVPDLFIMDAVVGMEGNGPASPDLRDIGLLLAADNAVAMDAVVARMMGVSPGALRFMRRAKEAGLGDYEEENIEVLGELKAIPGFKVPPLGGEAIIGNEAVQNMIASKASVRPKADPDLCTACESCVDQCPVGALSMGEENIPVVDADTCITCFCCQEICPEKAIALTA